MFSITNHIGMAPSLAQWKIVAWTGHSLVLLKRCKHRKRAVLAYLRGGKISTLYDVAAGLTGLARADPANGAGSSRTKGGISCQVRTLSPLVVPFNEIIIEALQRLGIIP